MYVTALSNERCMLIVDLYTTLLNNATATYKHFRAIPLVQCDKAIRNSIEYQELNTPSSRVACLWTGTVNVHVPLPHQVLQDVMVTL